MRNLILVALIGFYSTFALGVTNGRILKPAEYPSVVMIANEKYPQQLGTGIVVAPGIVITAAHVVFGNPDQYIVNGKIKVLKIINPVHVDSRLVNLDLSLILIDDVKLPALPVYTGLLPAGPVAVDIIGFGERYDSKSQVDSSIHKRIGRSILKDTSPGQFVWSLENTDGPHNLRNSAWAMPGDSGGPILWNGMVIGIASTSSIKSNYINLSNPAVDLFLKGVARKGLHIRSRTK